jgi:general secretion pathway protein F
MRFRIKAVDSSQAVSIYRIDALNESEARMQIAERGMQIISMARDLRLPSLNRKRFPLVLFSQELVALLDAGLSLVEAIDTLAEKEQNAATRRALDQIRARLMEGKTLSFALREIPDAFPSLYVATISASEKTGAIREAVTRFVNYQTRVDLLRKKVVSASIYPALLCSVGVLVTLFLVGFVVPRFSSIYQDLGTAVPASSRLMMKWGQLLHNHGMLAFIGFVVIAAAASYGASRPAFRSIVARAMTRIPAIGRQVFTYQLARFYRTAGMLLRGGTPAVTAMKMSAGLLSEGLKPNLERAIRLVQEGQSLTMALEGNNLTTPVSARMLRVGERSGNMGEMLERIAEFYDEELDRAVDILSRLIEPILMLVIGLVIGFVVVLMYFPIFELAGSIQ